MKSPDSADAGEWFAQGSPGAPAQRGATRWRWDSLLVWLGGGRDDVLDLCPGERPFFRALGLAVGLVSIFGGCGAALAAGYAFRHSAINYIWLGVLWAVVIANLDHLLLILIGGNRRQALAMVPIRIAISLLVSFVVAEPLALRIVAPEITEQLTQTNQMALTSQLTQAKDTYGTAIAADNAKVNTLQTKLSNLKNDITTYQYRARCESGLTDCSQSHILGQGPYYFHDKRLASNAKLNYERRRPVIKEQIAASEADAQQQQSDWDAAKQRITAGVQGSTGLVARERALGQLEHSNTRIWSTVWVIRAVFMLIDLTPMFAITVVSLMGSAYKRHKEALTEREGLAAEWVQAFVRFTRKSIKRREDAANTIDQAWVDAREDEWVSRAYGQPTNDGNWTRPTPRPPSEEIPSIAASDFATKAPRHELVPLPVQRPLNRLSWLGSGIALIAAVVSMLVAALAGLTPAAAVLAFGMLALLVTLAVKSKGFRHASIRLQRAMFGTAVAALLLHLLLLAVTV
jgi:hypothetical protein